MVVTEVVVVGVVGVGVVAEGVVVVVVVGKLFQPSMTGLTLAVTGT